MKKKTTDAKRFLFFCFHFFLWQKKQSERQHAAQTQCSVWIHQTTTRQKL